MDYPPLWLFVCILIPLLYTYWPQGEAKIRIRVAKEPEPKYYGGLDVCDRIEQVQKRTKS